MTIAKSRLLEVAQVGVVAGLAGGLAEVAWISIYGAISGVSVDIVAEEIAVDCTARFVLLSVGWDPYSSYSRHRSRRGGGVRDPPSIAWVWPRLCRIQSCDPDACHNMGREFLVVLPYVNPRFLDLLPYSVTLASKLLFGLVAATIFRIRAQS